MMTCSMLLFASSLVSGQAAAPAKADPKKTAAKKDDKKEKEEDRLENLIFAKLKEQAKKEDINNDGRLSRAELTTWLGITVATEFIKKYDKNADSMITYRTGPDTGSEENEFELWAR